MPARERPQPEEIGRYRIQRLQAQGAMGRVYLARDTVLDRDVALKLLRDDLEVEPDQRKTLIERMRQEARAAARVSHPNIVALHDMGEDPEFGLYLVFEYVEGVTLKERLERGPLGAVASARLATEIGSALTVAHEAGVLHRDIKPENILLAPTLSKVADFGIARIPDSTLTLAGGLLGTPAYSAPEAVSDGKFSPKSDQFSMAATLYEAISGKRAFPGNEAVVVARRISTEEPVPMAHSAGVDAHVDVVLARAFTKDPRGRFDTCEEFGNALSEALRMAPRSAMPTAPDKVHRQAAEGGGLRVAQVATGGVAIGVMLAIVVFQLTAHLQQDEGRRETTAPRVVATERPIEAEPVAWLSERPRPKKDIPPKPGRSPAPVRRGSEPFPEPDFVLRRSGPDGGRGDGGAVL